jgi:hypothetical protein
MQAVAELHFHLGELFKGVAACVFVGHANAAVQLQAVLADKAHGLPELVFGAGHGGARLGDYKNYLSCI